MGRIEHSVCWGDTCIGEAHDSSTLHDRPPPPTSCIDSALSTPSYRLTIVLLTLLVAFSLALHPHCGVWNGSCCSRDLCPNRLLLTFLFLIISSSVCHASLYDPSLWGVHPRGLYGRCNVLADIFYNNCFSNVRIRFSNSLFFTESACSAGI